MLLIYKDESAANILEKYAKKNVIERGGLLPPPPLLWRIN